MKSVEVDDFVVFYHNRLLRCSKNTAKSNS
jgi:hypothetical protein